MTTLIDQFMSALAPEERPRAQELALAVSAFARRVSTEMHEPPVMPSHEVGVAISTGLPGFPDAEAALVELDALTQKALGMSAEEFMHKSIEEETG
jgi:hypothetical protein